MTMGEERINMSFRRGKGTRDAIGGLRVLAERSLQHVSSVDLKKAFDRVDCGRKNMSAQQRII